DAKAVGSCWCYLEVLEQDARAGDEGCCYLPAWEQDAKMVGCHKRLSVEGASEKGRAVGYVAFARDDRSRVDSGRRQQVSSS
ncbi:hypothetical protein BHE74_00040749, partial [Ensete ventricosum]